MSTVEVPQITTLADVPAEFWMAMGIQILALVFGIWAVAKLIKFLVLSMPARVARRFDADGKTIPATDNVPTSIDEDFADIAAEMKKERDHA